MPQTTLHAPAGALPAYTSAPTTSGPWPGAVVVHDVFGMSDDLRSQADRLAAAGYLTVAPDLFGRGGGRFGNIRNAFKQLAAGSGPIFDDIEAARASLAASHQCTGAIGVVGFSLGGAFALLAAAAHPGFDAASVNYAQVPDNAAELLSGSCPIVASYGGRDKPFAAMPELLAGALTDAGVAFDLKIYRDSGHSFMNRGSGAFYALMKAASATTAHMGYQEQDAEDAWHRTIEFFDSHLKAADGQDGQQAARSSLRVVGSPSA
jgi:carboxymethylenebutenolidase